MFTGGIEMGHRSGAVIFEHIYHNIRHTHSNIFIIIIIVIIIRDTKSYTFS